MESHWKFCSWDPRAKARPHKWTQEDLEERVAKDPRVRPQRRLLTPFLRNKQVPPIPQDDSERIEYPFHKTNFISEFGFNWVRPLLQVGYRRTLEPEDLYKISPGEQMDVQVRTDQFMFYFRRRKLAAENKYLKKQGLEETEENRKQLASDPGFHYPRFLLLGALFNVFKGDYIVALLLKVVSDVGFGLNALQVRGFIKYIANGSASGHTSSGAYVLSVTISIVVFIAGITGAKYYNDGQVCGGEIRGILNKVLLDKSFSINRQGRAKYPPAVLTSYLGNDLSKIDLSASFFGFVTNLPIGLALSIILLIVNLGASVLAGIAYFLAFTVFVTWIAKLLMDKRVGANVATDARIRCIKEVLNSIKMVKYYAWEVPYGKTLAALRGTEMDRILHIQLVRNALSAVSVTLPSVSAMVGFLAMYGANHGLRSAANIFSSLTLFNVLTVNIAMFPTALTTAGDAIVACDRVQAYLLHPDEQDDPEYKVCGTQKEAISIQGGAFSWSRQNSESAKNGADSSESDSASETQLSPSLALNGINLDIHNGEFVVVTGSIGSGKSSLLQAIKGVMPRTCGSVGVAGEVTLCSDPWIQNTTVRENIFFGSAPDKRKYETVVRACALDSDLMILPAGDQTEIGERGVNLSGGQKARINLARAVYHVYGEDELNIVLLDDVLSAVDAKVGRHIVEHCILGLLADKTRVLATHQLALVGAASRVIFLNGDGTADVGTHDELMRRNSGFAELMQMEEEKTKEEEEDEPSSSGSSVKHTITHHLDQDSEETKKVESETDHADSDDSSENEKLDFTAPHANPEAGKMAVETRKINAIPHEVLVNYLRAGCGKGGIVLVVSALLFSVCATTFTMLFQNVWLSFWSSHKFSNLSDGAYAGIYVLVTAAFVGTSAWQFCTTVYICNHASKGLHIAALKRALHAPMAYFDTTPMGRILNRFTKDTDTLDNEIAEQTRLFFFGTGNMFGVLILCCIYLPWFLIAVPVVLCWCFGLFVYFQASSREIKRIEGVVRSNVFSTFDEVLQGVDTIKLYGEGHHFITKNTWLINKFNEAYLLGQVLQRWLVIRLHVLVAFVNLLMCVLVAANVFPISAASSGLLVSYLVSFSSQLISTTRAMGQLEQYLTSVERVNEFAFELPQEPDYHASADVHVPKSWPEKGEITFDKVCMRYRPGLPLALSDFSISVHSHEKIGICGRTGAGKSSIMSALYRLSEPEEGSITIDGIDTLTLGLYELRSRLTIIPQDPVLFNGTVRQNLDPVGQMDDSALYSALVRAGCIAAEELDEVRAQHPSHSQQLHKFHLDSLVEENGGNFSLGQRQVLALCRALVKDTKVLILDEATSSVDYETDARIQRTIASEFEHCTILCIAHRLKTIVNYDRILVMDKGHTAEFDTPWHLYQTSDSIFRSMCDKSGIGENDFIQK